MMSPCPGLLIILICPLKRLIELTQGENKNMFTRHYKVWPKDLPKTMTLPKTSLYTNLEVSALRYPDHNAIVYYDASMTYARLKREVDTMPVFLQDQVDKKGDQLLLYLLNFLL